MIFQHCLLASNCKTNTRFSSLSRGSQLLVRLLLLLTPNSQTNWVLDIKSQLYLVWISLESIKSKKWRGRQHLTSNPIWSGLSSSLQAPAKLQKGKNAFSFYLFSHWKMRHSHLFTPFFSSAPTLAGASFIHFPAKKGGEDEVVVGMRFPLHFIESAGIAIDENREPYC